MKICCPKCLHKFDTKNTTPKPPFKVGQKVEIIKKYCPSYFPDWFDYTGVVVGLKFRKAEDIDPEDMPSEKEFRCKDLWSVMVEYKVPKGYRDSTGRMTGYYTSPFFHFRLKAIK
jgi:hypothetical protein